MRKLTETVSQVRRLMDEWDEENKSISEASRQMHISSGNISAACRKIRPQASGCGWEYV